MARYSELMVEIYGSADEAGDAADFFLRGPGLKLREYLRGVRARLADLRFGMNNRKPLSLTDRAIVLHARELSIENLDTILGLMDQGELTDEEGGSDEDADDAPESE